MRSKRLGRSGLRVPVVGVGTAFLGYTDAVTAHGPIGSVPVDEEYGTATLEAAVAGGCTLIDTAPFYSDRQAERIVGRLVRQRPGLLAGCVLSTKVGMYVGSRDYSYDGVLRSVEASMDRMGADRVDLISVHDAQGEPLNELLSPRGALGALHKLRDQGVIKAIGTACADLETNTVLVETGEFDVAMIPGGWSLLSQKIGRRLLPAAERLDVGLLIATPLERGLLATGPVPGQPHRARHFSAEALDYVRDLQALCSRYGVPLLAAALQWPSRHPAVASCAPGPRTPEEARSNAAAATADLPDALWAELEPMIRDWDYRKEPA